MAPLGVLIVPSKDAVMPLPATAVLPVGTSSGGQTAVQEEPVQVTLPPWSAVSMYSVLPCALTNAFPRSPTDATLTVTPFAGVVLGDVLGPDVPVEPVLAHAASNTARIAPKPADKKM